MIEIGSKSEARNPKFETILNYRNTKSNAFSFGTLEDLNFDIASDFNIRISNFSVTQS